MRNRKKKLKSKHSLRDIQDNIKQKNICMWESKKNNENKDDPGPRKNNGGKDREDARNV